MALKQKILATKSILSLTEDLVIGADFPGNPEYFKGKLDELIIYDRALNDIEICQLMNDSSPFQN